jgi:hypothetical protein
VDNFDDDDSPRRYPWADWTVAGTIWEITRGEDYDVATENMRVNLHERAKVERKTVRTKIIRRDDSEGLRFQFFGTPAGQALPAVSRRL